VLKSTPAWLLLIGTLALGFYFVNAVHYEQLPLRIEENEWPPMAKAIFESGKPVIAPGETHRVTFTSDLQVEQDERIGAWHPPLYLYSLAASMVVIGTDSPNMLRVVGVIGLLAAAIIMLLIAREVTSRWRVIGGVAAVLLLIHPYAIQGSLFLDIDTSIYLPLALLVLWAAIRYGKRERSLSPLHILAIGGALALVTWAKMTTTIVLVGMLVVWWLLYRRPLRRAAAEAVAFVALGAALFFSTYALWCNLTGIPFSYMFNANFSEKSSRLFSDWRLVDDAAHWHLRWFGAALILLALIYLVDLGRHFLAQRRLRPLDLPFLVSIGVLVQYVAVSPADGTYQGKYAFPALATMLLPISWMLLRSQTHRVRPLLWAVAAGIGLVVVLLLPDLLTGLSYNGSYGAWDFELWITAIVAATLLLTWRLGGKRGFADGVVVVLVMLFTAQSIHSYRANSSPMYPIPDTEDFRAAARDLNRETSKEDIVVAPKDLGFYVKRRVVEGEDAFARGDALLASVIRRYANIAAFARDSFGPPVGPETEAILNRCFLDRRVFGTATVAYRSGNCSSSGSSPARR
jgi:hypothetical protein